MPLIAAMVPKHTTLASWALSRGIVTHGVKLAPIPGKGIGLIASTKLSKGDVLLTLPTPAIITEETPLVRDVPQLKDVVGTVHGRLAAALLLNSRTPNGDDDGNGEADLGPWREVWPSRSDFASMPLLWLVEAQQRLLPECRELLAKQRAKLDTDWAVYGPALTEEGVEREEFEYYWLVVNTRVFFWPHAVRWKAGGAGGGKRRKIKSVNQDECLALCPVADYLNHAGSGCAFESNPRECRIVCDRTYEEGEEVVVSYGPHTNAFLLVEYGFTLKHNPHDTLCLDSVILPGLSEEQEEWLEAHNYLGGYVLSSSGFCFRTQVALRADTVAWANRKNPWRELTIPEQVVQLEAFIAGEDPDKDFWGSDLIGCEHDVKTMTLDEKVKELKELWDEDTERGGEGAEVQAREGLWRGAMRLIDMADDITRTEYAVYRLKEETQ
ncbi:SET domain-containing protein [Trichodelitschia bisporula]|uniref:SET domain-containing protein n=1 Tax=Trichodelitschia bisporula TaxID=703511 RepID=A0A6G1I1D6_9PEZI|nr:SET domain-containing protein [Trichodelitschia bisporula]